jgi:hypothetical protein
MIARHRGDERVHSSWRPTAATGVVPGRRDPEPEQLLDPDPVEPELLEQPAAAPRRARTLTGVAVVIVIAAIAAHQHHSSALAASLPSTARQWVEQWTAASLENPARVCQRLFAPALAAAFKGDTGRSCLTYYSSATSRPFRFRHLMQDGPTAAVEAQQLVDARRSDYFTLVLSHVRDGWQAIDIVPGGSVRPR